MRDRNEDFGICRSCVLKHDCYKKTCHYIRLALEGIKHFRKLFNLKKLGK